ncbi:MAG: hypothetical protein AB8F34_15550 [Akkermansiaceae bacterium]
MKMIKYILCAVSLLSVPNLTALAEEIPRVPRGKAGDPADKIKFEHLKLREGVRLFYGASMIRSNYPYVWVQLPGAEKHLEFTHENAQQVFTPIKSEQAAMEFVRFFHTGITIDSEKVYTAAMKAAEKLGFKATIDKTPTHYGFKAMKGENGSIEVRLLIYGENHGQYQLQEYRYFFGKNGFEKKEKMIYLKGPYTSWQTGPLDTEQTQNAEAKRWSELARFSKEVGGAINKAEQ